MVTTYINSEKKYACNGFSTQFRKIILRDIKIGYNINVIRQTACMVNPITVNNFASLFGCITKTCLYNFDPLKPHLYSKTGV